MENKNHLIPIRIDKIISQLYIFAFHNPSRTSLESIEYTALDMFLQIICKKQHEVGKRKIVVSFKYKKAHDDRPSWLNYTNFM